MRIDERHKACDDLNLIGQSIPITQPPREDPFRARRPRIILFPVRDLP